MASRLPCGARLKYEQKKLLIVDAYKRASTMTLIENIPGTDTDRLNYQIRSTNGYLIEEEKNKVASTAIHGGCSTLSFAFRECEDDACEVVILEWEVRPGNRDINVNNWPKSANEITMVFLFSTATIQPGCFGAQQQPALLCPTPYPGISRSSTSGSSARWTWSATSLDSTQRGWDPNASNRTLTPRLLTSTATTTEPSAQTPAVEDPHYLVQASFTEGYGLLRNAFEEVLSELIATKLQLSEVLSRE